MDSFRIEFTVFSQICQNSSSFSRLGIDEELVALLGNYSPVSNKRVFLIESDLRLNVV